MIHPYPNISLSKMMTLGEGVSMQHCARAMVSGTARRPVRRLRRVQEPGTAISRQRRACSTIASCNWLDRGVQPAWHANTGGGYFICLHTMQMGRVSTAAMGSSRFAWQTLRAAATTAKAPETPASVMRRRLSDSALPSWSGALPLTPGRVASAYSTLRRGGVSPGVGHCRRLPVG